MRRILTISVYMEDKCTWKIKLLSGIFFCGGMDTDSGGMGGLV